MGLAERREQTYQPVDSWTSASVLAPTGRRTVATGAAPSAARRTKRNPWTEASILDPAPKGQRNATLTRRAIEPPSPLRGDKRKDAHSTGCAPAGCAAPPLHPWLHPAAPSGP